MDHDQLRAEVPKKKKTDSIERGQICLPHTLHILSELSQISGFIWAL